MDALTRLNAKILLSGFSFQVLPHEVDQGFIKDRDQAGTSFWRKTLAVNGTELLCLYNYYNGSKSLSAFSGEHLTFQDKRLMNKQKKQADEAQDANYLRVKGFVSDRIQTWKDCGAGNSPYLKRKGLLEFRNHIGARKAENTNETILVVPMLDSLGEVWNVQQIWPGGEKRFWPGGRTKGLFFIFPKLGDVDSDFVYLAEGFATAASVALATGQQTFAAFSKSNLEAVLKICLERTTVPVRLCVDWDARTRERKGVNVGLKECLRLARKYRVDLVMPFDHLTEKPPESKNVDFSDLYVNNIDLTKRCLKQPISWGEL